MTKVKDIKIYSTATCAYCHAEKQFLNEHKIPFNEVMVDSDEKGLHELQDLSGQLGVPFTVITKEDDTQEKVLGFDQPRLTAILGL
jgi:glutaredoxin 3